MTTVPSKQHPNELVIADFDLMWCQRYLAAYLDLLRKPVGASDQWASLEFEQFTSDLNALDILARSLVTSIVISYSRPWSNSLGAAGQRSKLPKTIFRDMNQVGNARGTESPMLPFHHAIHKRVLKARDKLIAHSDAAEWDIQIAATTHGFEISANDPFQYLLESDARALLENTRSLRSEIKHRERKALGDHRRAFTGDAQLT